MILTFNTLVAVSLIAEPLVPPGLRVTSKLRVNVEATKRANKRREEEYIRLGIDQVMILC